MNELLDVIIIGAGLSGIGAAVHLSKRCPGKSFAILEGRKAMGGTWDLFRYPGIRSDSDMYTLGYEFKPWTRDKSIADGKDIREYIQETAREYGVEDRIRYQHKVKELNWNSRKACWRVQVEKTVGGAQSSDQVTEAITLEARFVICGTGYYRYDQGISPQFAGRDDFKGQVIHPQFWPEDLDYAGKKVVVIGSGATAVTLVPALAKKAAQVTMLQRSPTYVMTLPEKDPMIDSLRKVFPEKWVYRLTRARNVTFSTGFYNIAQRFPEFTRNLILNQAQRQLGSDFDMKHFSPNYNPWDQRLCAVPNGDLFRALRKGEASVVTDHIERFTETGILLKSGKELPADIIVTATGLDVQLLGGMELKLDGQPVVASEKHYYKGAMLEDVPNLTMIFGYTNSSWTLKADLISDYFCRIIQYMDEQGYAQCTARNHGRIKASEPFLNLSSSYVQRVIDQVPKQGDIRPWRLYQNYFKDYAAFRFTRIKDPFLVFSNPVTHNDPFRVATGSTATS